MKRFIFAVAALMTLIACLPEEDAADNDAESSAPILDLATFQAWPEGSVDQADPEAIGRDNLIFIVDRSGSMWDESCVQDATGEYPRKTSVVIQALQEFIPQIPDDTAVGWIDFGDNTEVRVPLGLNNRAALMQAAGNHAPDMGGTIVGHATNTGFELLAEQALQQGSTGTYRLVLIVDGGAGDRTVLSRTLDQINQTPVEVITAGFCINSRHMLNQPKDNVYVEASNVEDMIGVLQQSVRREASTFVDFAATPVAVTE